MQHELLTIGRIAVAALLAAIMPVADAEPAPAAPPTVAPGGTPVPPKAVFAVVNGRAIDVERYEAELGLLIREKFFHRRPSQEQMLTVRRETGDRLIEKVLLLAECKRRGIQPDTAKVAEYMATFEENNKRNPKWIEQRQSLAPQLRQELEEMSMLERIAAAVRVAPQPSEDELLGYYAGHKDKFTEPDRLRLSVIVVGVKSSSEQAEWDKAKVQAAELRQQLIAGADFAALARQHSKDGSAQQGGDMGYVHRGMLSDELQAEIDKLKPGEVSGPLQMLEGVALYRVDEHIKAQPKSFDESKKRAQELWQREQGERQWQDLKAVLRTSAVIEVITPALYPAIAEADKAAEKGGSK